MYHALTIGLSDSLLVDLQALFLHHHLQFIAAATLQAASQHLAEAIFHLLIVDLEYLRSIQQTHWLSTLRLASFAPIIVLSDTPELDLASVVDLGADVCISRKWPHSDIAEMAHAQLRRYTEYNHYDDPDHSEVGRRLR